MVLFGAEIFKKLGNYDNICSTANIVMNVTVMKVTMKIVINYDSNLKCTLILFELEHV